MVDFVVDSHTEPESVGPIGAFNEVVNKVQNLFDGDIEYDGEFLDDTYEMDVNDFDHQESSRWNNLSETISDVWDDAVDNINTLESNIRELIDISDSNTSLDGLGVWQDSTSYDLEGTIDSDGNVNLQGEDSHGYGNEMTIDGEVDEDGEFNGTFEITYGSGNPDSEGETDGDLSDIGSCEASVGSGGQGTFTYAHYVGKGPGVIDFYYQAYSIPDAFTITGPSGPLFSTGGLISGSSTVPVTVFNESWTTVFVSVSAPQSGTSWNYQLGCLDN
jgi:hypothetical protein